METDNVKLYSALINTVYEVALQNECLSELSINVLQ